MSLILFGGSENRGESERRLPVEENVCKAAPSKHPLKAHDDCYHRAVQRTLFERRSGSRKLIELLIRGGFGVIIMHIEGGDVGGGITGGEGRVGSKFNGLDCTLRSMNINGRTPVTEANKLPSV